MVECRKMSISSTRTNGAYFPFFGRSRQQAEPPVHLSYSSSRNNVLSQYFTYSFIFNSKQFPTIPQNTSPIGSQHYYFLPFLICPINNFLTLLPYPGAHFPLTKLLQNTPLYPLLHTPINHSLFPLKYLKMA